jgi:hypothetical protein
MVVVMHFLKPKNTNSLGVGDLAAGIAGTALS